jgi:cation transport ATPase
MRPRWRSPASGSPWARPAGLSPRRLPRRLIALDRVDQVADALHVGRRILHIARQSVLAGMGLSLAAMGVAAFGYLPPVAGALVQEAIDLAVILNARPTRMTAAAA